MMQLRITWSLPILVILSIWITCCLASTKDLYADVDLQEPDVAPPVAVTFATMARITVPGSVGGQCSFDPIAVSGTLSKTSSKGVGLVYRGAGSSQQIYFIWSPNGETFGQPILLQGVTTTARSVAAIIFNGQLWVAWQPLTTPTFVMWAVFEGDSSIPVSGPMVIERITGTNYPPTFAFAPKARNVLSVLWTDKDDGNKIYSSDYTGAGNPWSSAAVFPTADSSNAAVGTALREDFQRAYVVFRANQNNGYLFSVNTQTYWNATGNTVNTNDNWIHSTYSRPSIISWQMQSDPLGMLAVYTRDTGELYYKYLRNDDTWQNNGYITWQGAQILPSSSPTTWVSYLNNDLYVYWCAPQPTGISELTFGRSAD